MVKNETNAMLGINSYGRELSREDIEENKHRQAVGGLWDELGRLQFEFLKKQGLQPYHKLLDIGCGCLRGGIHFINYLDQGNYYGLDINESLLEAGKHELAKTSLQSKRPTLLCDDKFRLSRFAEKFDFMISISVFTHLPMNIIIRCLAEAGQQLRSDGIYFSTFFEAPAPVYLDNLVHNPGGIITKYDSDPFHYAFEELAWMANLAGLKSDLIGEWGHPRDQKMAAFRLR